MTILMVKIKSNCHSANESLCNEDKLSYEDEEDYDYYNDDVQKFEEDNQNNEVIVSSCPFCWWG